MLIAIFLSFIYAIILALVIIFIIDFSVTGWWYRWKAGKHFDGKYFSNIWWTKRETYRVESHKGEYGKFKAFVWWMLQRRKPRWVKRKGQKVIPVERYLEDDFKITFIGHATLLIQIAGLNIITDPVWGYRASPFTRIGPHRYMDPGVDLDHLPPIDIVILSHNHYDHMEIPTLQKLHKRDNPIIYTGLGNVSYLAKYWVRNVVDMDWWDKNEFDKRKIAITYVPAQHFSARGIYDRNKTLWGGFVLEVSWRSLYFAWDTGYGEFVEKIKERFPDGFDVWLLPIGAYKPRWFMADIHTNPEEALMMQRDLSIKTGLWIHWWTFPLADDCQDDPLIDLAIAQEKEEFKNIDFRVGVNGTEWKI
jgi:L-ascorbate metabolism protein UlaG (beta-lactamase superfamily)